ncbi:MAG: hypothetical protein ACYSO4_02195, partial [Planctomycetota bacterium]
MKKLLGLLVIMGVTAIAYAVPDISYSSDTGGHWSYSASATSGEGAFSFIQPVGVDDVQGLTTDALVNAFLHIPNLTVSNLTQIGSTGIYEGDVIPAGTTIAIKDGGGIDILTGTLGTGGIVTVGTTASVYPTFQVDITITGLSNTIGSAFITTLAIGNELDFDLTLNGSAMASMILTNQDNEEGSTLSGSMTVIPEPAT